MKELLYSLTILVWSASASELVISRSPFCDPVPEGESLSLWAISVKAWESCKWFFKGESDSEFEQACYQLTPEQLGKEVGCQGDDRPGLSGGTFFNDRVCSLIIQSMNSSLTGQWKVQMRGRVDSALLGEAIFQVASSRAADVSLTANQTDLHADGRYEFECSISGARPAASAVRWTLDGDEVLGQESWWAMAWPPKDLHQDPVVHSLSLSTVGHLGNFTLACHVIQGEFLYASQANLTFNISPSSSVQTMDSTLIVVIALGSVLILIIILIIVFVIVFLVRKRKSNSHVSNKIHRTEDLRTRYNFGDPKPDLPASRVTHEFSTRLRTSTPPPDRPFNFRPISHPVPSRPSHYPSTNRLDTAF